MTITVVASTASAVASGTTITLTYGTVQAGDIAIAATAITRTGTIGTVSSSSGFAYTQIGTTATAGNLVLTVWARVLSAADTIALSSSTGNAQDGCSACVTVVRGIAPSIAGLLFSSAATATSANPNSPTMAVGSTNAIVLSIAAQIANNTVTTLPTGYSSGANAGVSDTRSSRIALSFISGSDQAFEDPPQWTFSASAQWLAVTVGAFDSGSIYYPIRSENFPDMETEARRVIVRSY